MTSTVSYMTVADAIRASDVEFLAAVENAVVKWLEATPVSEITVALFDYSVADQEVSRKAA